MRYSVSVPNFGEFAAPEVFAEVACQAEQAGWDALLVGDSVTGEKDLRWEIADPWILLTAAALATRRIRLGTAVTPVARRRPSKLARERVSRRKRRPGQDHGRPGRGMGNLPMIILVWGFAEPWHSLATSISGGTERQDSAARPGGSGPGKCAGPGCGTLSAAPFHRRAGA